MSFKDFQAWKVFENAMRNGFVLVAKARDFDELRKKIPDGTPERMEADRLWAEYERNKDRYSTKPSSPVAKPGAGENKGKHVLMGRKPAGSGNIPLTSAQTNNAGGAPASVLGSPFHNPYTFMPFPSKTWIESSRRIPTLLTADEMERERFTGVIELTVRTLSPLMTCDPVPVSGNKDAHKTYKALNLGTDVIVPATGVRGALRALLGMVAGTLGYLDEEVWLCQGRDLPLGPAGKTTPHLPRQCFLAEVVEPGATGRSGKIRLGNTRLIPLSMLKTLVKQKKMNLERPGPGRPQTELWVSDNKSSVSSQQDETHVWRVKLSGRPINEQGKREGMFRPGNTVIELSGDFWMAYNARNRFGDHPELHKGDLVWLEVKEGVSEIKSESDIASLQWARWGRRGSRLLQVIRQHHAYMLPDCMNPDGKVDVVTDLFGQVPRPDLARIVYPERKFPSKEFPGPAGPFAARVRPDNLVFFDAADQLERGVVLSPLAPPHPGCRAFYRNNLDPDKISEEDGLRGCKVYRTTRERGMNAPWYYQTQGVYGERGELLPEGQRVNKTVDLLEEGCTGTVRLAVRSLASFELALLLAACTVDWRLGGGKPLGLGHCRVVNARLIDEFGQEKWNLGSSGNGSIALPEDLSRLLPDELRKRFENYRKMQEPVAFLRYPRAVSENKNRLQRGGHVWFQRHAKPKMGTQQSGVPGLMVMWVDNGLSAKAGGKDRIQAQVLPEFNESKPQSDLLYGYDGFVPDSKTTQTEERRTFISECEPFDPKAARQQQQSGGNMGKNRDSRRDERKNNR